VKIFSRAEAAARYARRSPDNGVLLSAHELPVDALWRWPDQFVVGQCTVARILIEAESQLNSQDSVTRAH
jgi:hypothetical protein